MHMYIYIYKSFRQFLPNHQWNHWRVFFKMGPCLIPISPGIPSIFWDHVCDWGEDCRARIKALLKLRQKAEIKVGPGADPSVSTWPGFIPVRNGALLGKWSIFMGISWNFRIRFNGLVRLCTIFLAMFCADIPWNLGLKDRAYTWWVPPILVPESWPLTTAGIYVYIYIYLCGWSNYSFTIWLRESTSETAMT